MSTPLLGVLLFVFSAAFPPFDDATEVDLTLHMTQHVLIVISGVLVAYPAFGRGLLGRGRSSLGWLGLVVSSVLILFWHYPLEWDAAVLNPAIHVAEHLSFFFVGVLCGSWVLLLSDSAKIGSLLAAFFGHMGYAVILISPWNVQVYELYPLANQVVLGWALLLTGPVLTVGIAYVVARNPSWLAGYSGKSGSDRGPRETVVNRIRVPKPVVPVLSLMLALTLVGYSAFTVYAISTQANYNGMEPVVYIEETPVSWQYSPQNLTVVLGVNSTVIWVSHSISFDTVTGRGTSTGPCGTGFASCPIPPGQTYSFTFTKPGVYEYYCQYHPWMVGRVTVIAA